MLPYFRKCILKALALCMIRVAYRLLTGKPATKAPTRAPSRE
jgi:hypothetical protein